MISCVERFQQIISDIDRAEPQVKTRAIQKYIDLCNEELFYFKNDYLPEKVKSEWLEGMAYYLPWFDEQGQNLNPYALQEIITDELLKNYPRIREVFSVHRKYNLDDSNDRTELIERLRQNLASLRS